MKNPFDTILPKVIAETVVSHRGLHGLTDNQVKWFVDFCDKRIRHLYKINQNWKRKLNSRSNAGRDYCYTFVNHWLDAYLVCGEEIAR